jgi:hypothetical protein
MATQKVQLQLDDSLRIPMSLEIYNIEKEIIKT